MADAGPMTRKQKNVNEHVSRIKFKFMADDTQDRFYLKYGDDRDGRKDNEL